jgi:hypothetical protein
MFNRCLTKKESGKVFFKKQCDKRIEELEQKVRMLESPDYAKRVKVLEKLQALENYLSERSIFWMRTSPVVLERMALEVYEYFKVLKMEAADTRPEWVQNLAGISKHYCSLCMTPANTRITDGKKDVYFCEECAEVAVVSMPATPEALEAIHKRLAEIRVGRKRGSSW